MMTTRSDFLRGTLAAAGTGLGPASAAVATRPTARPAAAGSFRVLVLSGGTAWGAYEAGVLYGLPQAAGGARGYDAVCGTSAGALNGAFYVTGKVEPLRRLWQTVASRPVLVVKPKFAKILERSAGVGTRASQLVSLLLGITAGDVRAACESDPVRSILREFLAPNGTVAEFAIPLFWTVTDLTDGCGGMFYREASPRLRGTASVRTDALARVTGSAPGSARSFTNALGVQFTRVDTADEFVETLRASSAIPGVFEPAELNGRLLVDGGVVNNTPLALVRQAATAGPVTVDVVLLGADFRGQENAKSKNLIQIVQGLYALIGQRLTDDAVRALAAQDVASRSRRALDAMQSAFTARSPAARTLSAHIESLQQQSAGTYLPNEVTINVIRPSVPRLNGDSLDFTDQTAISANFDQGLTDVTRFGFTPYRTPVAVCDLGPA